jgi:formamidase
MSGLGGLNKSPNGVVIGVVQLQLPVVVTSKDLAVQTEKIVAMVGKARRNMATMDLVVFPEYSLHGLSMDMNPAIMCSLDGPEIAAFKQACRDNGIWGCFSLMEFNPKGNPYNSGVIIDDAGSLQLYYRKMHPWTPVEPWEPGDAGIPVCDGPKGAKLALIICHDGMFPEMARECAYKGAEIMIRTAGYTAPIRDAWRFTNQANSFQNLMATANVCMCGSDGSFDSMGQGMIVNFDGLIIAEGTTVENNIYQLGHRGLTAVAGGAGDCPYTFMQDLVAGRYRLPWEDEVVHKDGTAYGFPRPTRRYGEALAKAAE